MLGTSICLARSLVFMNRQDVLQVCRYVCKPSIRVLYSPRLAAPGSRQTKSFGDIRTRRGVKLGLGYVCIANLLPCTHLYHSLAF